MTQKKFWVTRPSEAEIAYAAGFFDGEGSLAFWYKLTPSQWRFEYRASVSQHKSQVPLLWLKERFGGSVNKSQWWASHNDATRFLTLILPYLLVRGKDVEFMLKVWSSRFDRPTVEELQKVVPWRKIA